MARNLRDHKTSSILGGSQAFGCIVNKDSMANSIASGVPRRSIDGDKDMALMFASGSMLFVQSINRCAASVQNMAICRVALPSPSQCCEIIKTRCVWAVRSLICLLLSLGMAVIVVLSDSCHVPSVKQRNAAPAVFGRPHLIHSKIPCYQSAHPDFKDSDALNRPALLASGTSVGSITTSRIFNPFPSLAFSSSNISINSPHLSTLLL